MAPPKKQGSAIATLVMGFSTSLIIGVPLGRVVASAYNWKVIFGGLGILGLLAMLIIFFTIPRSKGDEPVPLRKQQKQAYPRRVPDLFQKSKKRNRSWLTQRAISL
jgi:MFS transporter, DHA1 family, putative efflux transporter